MQTNHQTENRKHECDVQRMIEPLASYLCATDQPRAALKMALATLFDEMEQINLAANSQVTDFLETRYVVPV